MRILLDTHTLMWWAGKSKRLPTKVRDLLEDRTNEVFMSVANAWEMQIKAQLGKLTLHKPWPEIVRDEMTTNGFRLVKLFSRCAEPTFFEDRAIFFQGFRLFCQEPCTLDRMEGR